MRHGDATLGMIGLRNRAGGCRDEDRETVKVLLRKRAEIAPRDSEERSRQFTDSPPDLVWIRHADTLRMEDLNPARESIRRGAAAVSGRGPARAVGSKGDA